MNLALAAPRRVAIVGGGLSGLACANALQNVMDVSVWDMGKSGPGNPLWPTVPGGLVIDNLDFLTFTCRAICTALTRAA
jgi:predicted NAD/FAD-binding protein